MQLNTAQCRTLRFYLQYKDRVPPWSDFFKRFVPTVGLWLVIVAIGSYVCIQIGFPSATVLLFGIVIGAAAREIRYGISARQIWPIIQLIVDWKVAEELNVEQR